MEDRRNESYKKIADKTSESRSGYQKFDTGEKDEEGRSLHGSSTGDVLITRGTRVDRLGGGVASNLVFASSSEVAVVANQESSASPPLTPAGTTTTKTTSSRVPISVGVASKLISDSRGMSLRDDVQYQVGATNILVSQGERKILNPQVRYPQSRNTNESGNVSRNNPSGFVGPDLDGNKDNFEAAKSFAERVDASQAREARFWNSEGFERVSQLSNFVTFGGGVKKEDRSFIGQTSENVAFGLFSWPIALGGTLPSAGEKIGAVAEGLYRNPKDTFNEIFIDAPKRVEQGPYSFLPGGTPINAEGASTVISAGIFAGTSYPSFKNNALTRTTLENVYPEKFVKSENLGIKFVEDYTESTSITQLKSLEGKEAKTIHVTTSNIFGDTLLGKGKEFVTVAQDTGAGGFRQQNMLLNFYKSSPEPATGTPRAYLGYAGIMSKGAESLSSGKVAIGKPTIRLLQFNDLVSETPKGIANQGLLEINKYQAKTSGETFVPAENLVGASREGQLITPSKYSDIPRAKNFGLDNTQGSIIRRAGDSKYSFYRQNPSYSSNSFVRSFQKVSQAWNDFSGKSYFQFEVVPSETISISKSQPVLSEKRSVLDLDEYNAYYGKTKYYQPKTASSPEISVSEKSLVSSTPYVRSKVLSYVSNASAFNSSVTSARYSSKSLISSTGKTTYSSLLRSKSNVSSISSGNISSISSVNSNSRPYEIMSPTKSVRSSYTPQKLTAETTVTPKYRRLSYRSGNGKFNVLARRKGQFQLVGRTSSLSKAFQIGSSFVGNTSSATFKVVSGAGLVKGDAGSNFYSKGGLFIERPSRRIKSAGELREITFKGVAASRKRRGSVI